MIIVTGAEKERSFVHLSQIEVGSLFSCKGFPTSIWLRMRDGATCVYDAQYKSELLTYFIQSNDILNQNFNCCYLRPEEIRIKNECETTNG